MSSEIIIICFHILTVITHQDFTIILLDQSFII